MSNTDQIDPIECAILDLEAAAVGRPLDQWSPAEMRQLKRLTAKLDFGPDLYRAMVAENNNWGSRAGRADINQIEKWQREYEYAA